MTDAAGNTGNATRTVVVVDNTPPVITISGDATTYHHSGSYTDAGATANDPCFGPVSNLQRRAQVLLTVTLLVSMWLLTKQLMIMVILLLLSVL